MTRHPTLLAVVAALASLSANPLLADNRSDEPPPHVVVTDSEISEDFRVYVGRTPSRRELERYRRMSDDQSWDREEFRRGFRSSNEFRDRYVDEAIEHAYRDLLDRRPDIEGRAHYRDLMIKHGLTEEELYRRLKDSEEFRVTVPNARITNAYREVFHRDPDRRGLDSYRGKVVDRGWTQEDIEKDLRHSAEYEAMVDDIIRRIYREVLSREPDKKGLESYRRTMIDREWSEDRLRDDLKKSEEYRQLHGNSGGKKKPR